MLLSILLGDGMYDYKDILAIAERVIDGSLSPVSFNEKKLARAMKELIEENTILKHTLAHDRKELAALRKAVLIAADTLDEYAEIEETHSKRHQEKHGGELIKSAAREVLNEMSLAAQGIISEKQK